ncbi:hypothetical protein G6045_19155 [Streptomyces sp. YC504]|uniref:Uncharacterized protein n=1 Tax=Streptomyces mesophilus TaxID=1775132 RepID=A0A6G4XMB8_9ACTN|nr:hypothetical protein [Streptomyces mesophilus]NGO77761.1 hypothetical protein [Streptomyces mesophilus]
MMYDQQRAQQPPSKTPDPTKRRGPQPSRTEPARERDRATDPVLLPQNERDELALRLQQALDTSTDKPRQAVEEADAVLSDAITRLTAALTEHRRLLRTGWQDEDTELQPEELRLTLDQYRQITELLLRL